MGGIINLKSRGDTKNCLKKIKKADAQGYGHTVTFK